MTLGEFSPKWVAIHRSKDRRASITLNSLSLSISQSLSHSLSHTHPKTLLILLACFNFVSVSNEYSISFLISLNRVMQRRFSALSKNFPSDITGALTSQNRGSPKSQIFHLEHINPAALTFLQSVQSAQSSAVFLHGEKQLRWPFTNTGDRWWES